MPVASFLAEAESSASSKVSSDSSTESSDSSVESSDSEYELSSEEEDEEEEEMVADDEMDGKEAVTSSSSSSSSTTSSSDEADKEVESKPPSPLAVPVKTEELSIKSKHRPPSPVEEGRKPSSPKGVPGNSQHPFFLQQTCTLTNKTNKIYIFCFS